MSLAEFNATVTFPDTATIDNGTGPIVVQLDGPSVIFVNENGEQGGDGPPGASVVAGEVNDSGFLILELSTGQFINVGHLVGPQGNPGNQGIPGNNGQDGVSVVSGTINGSGDLVFTLSDSTTVNVGHVVGAKGDKGDKGDQGDDGLYVTGAAVNGSNRLIISLSNGLTIDAGSVLPADSGYTRVEVDGFLAQKQPLDSDLTAISGLTFAANQIAYATGPGVWAVTTVTSQARQLLDDTSFAAMLTTLGAAAASHTHTTSQVTGLDSALAAKAPLASPPLTGTPTAPTAALGTNTTQIATMAAIQAAIANLINSAPGALDTLDELAAALGDDPNFATTITNSLAQKQPLDGNLTSIASKTYSANQMIYWTADDVVATFNTTAFGRGLLNLADAAALRTSAGLGTMATAAASNYYNKTEVDGLLGSSGSAYTVITTTSSIDGGASVPFVNLFGTDTNKTLTVTNTTAVDGDYLVISHIPNEGIDYEDHSSWLININGISSVGLGVGDTVRYRFSGTLWFFESYISGFTSIVGALGNQFIKAENPQFFGSFSEELLIQSISGTHNIDPSQGNVQKLTMTSNVSLVMPPNPDVLTTTTYTFILVQDATGGRTVTWPSSVKWDGDVAPTLTGTANRADVISLLWSGTYWLASFVNKNVVA